MSKRYVQHISGQGETWEVDGPCHGSSWFVLATEVSYWLPKSEYRLVEPPERWVDVTENCSYDNDGAILGPKNEPGGHPIIGYVRQGENIKGYRLRKVRAIIEPNQFGNSWAFIIEKKEPQP